MSRTPLRRRPGDWVAAAGAIGVTAVIALVVDLPMVLVPWAVEAILPFAEWRFAMHWWVVPVGALALFAVSFAVAGLKGALPRVFPILARRWYAEWGAEVVEFLVLIAVYWIVLTPLFAAAIAAVAVTALALLATPPLDRALERQNRRSESR